MRGLCSGLGPAVFGFIFYLFQMDLNIEKTEGGEQRVSSSYDHLWKLVSCLSFLQRLGSLWFVSQVIFRITTFENLFIIIGLEYQLRFMLFKITLSWIFSENLFSLFQVIFSWLRIRLYPHLQYALDTSFIIVFLPFQPNSSASGNGTSHHGTSSPKLVPGPPFVFGALMVICALLVAAFIPEERSSKNRKQSGE